MANCSNCQAEVPAGQRFCGQCGAPVGESASPETPGASRQAAEHEFTVDVMLDVVRKGLARLSTAERIVMGATFVLFISLFLPWYSFSVGGASISLSALDTGAGGFRVLILLLCILILIYYSIRAFGLLKLGTAAAERTVRLAATGVNALLVLIAFFVKPASGFGWSFGAFVGLTAALVALGAAVREHEGFALLVHPRTESGAEEASPPALVPAAAPPSAPPPQPRGTALGDAEKDDELPPESEVAQRFDPPDLRESEVVRQESAEANGEPAQAALIEQTEQQPARFCTSCGSENPPANRFCRSCGRALAAN